MLSHQGELRMMDLLLNRVTPAELSDPAPGVQQLEQAIAAAQAAPDHGRLRPWRFIVVRDDARHKLGHIMAEALRQRDPAALPEQLEKEAAKALRAPLIVVVACSVQPSEKIPELEQVMAVSAAAQNFQLALLAQGFGCQWKTGPASRDGYVKAALGLHPADHIIGFMYVGSIAKPGKPRSSELDHSKVGALA